MKLKILSAGKLPESIIQKYSDEFDFIIPERTLTYDEVYELIDQADGYFIMNGIKADRNMINKGTKLKVVGNFGVGYDCIDWNYCTEKGIAVVNTPTQVSDATAEHTACLIFDTMRGIARSDRQVRNRIWYAPEFPDHNTAINGSTLGIIGFGRIGKLVCKKAQGMGMNVIYYDKFRVSEEIEKEFGVTYMEFEEVLAKADCISVHMPYIPENHHIINAGTLKKMKSKAYLVNAARGPIVDEKALCEALKNGVIRGAGLDVYENEPHPYEGLYELDNVVLTPHCASGTMKARLGMAKEALDGITAVLKGKQPCNVVNPEIFK